MAATDNLHLVLNGKPTVIKGVSPTTTLLDWLREHAGLRGTKEGCAEGDCGACTVVIERLGTNAVVVREAVNSCLTMIGQVDGLGVRTVEGLRSSDGTLDAVQSAFVETGGTQCGFCTPGFVMSAHAFARGGEPVEPSLIHDALAGNLCRCTGYRSIVEAITRAVSTNGDAADTAESGLADALLAAARDEAVSFRFGEFRFDVPKSLADAADLRARFPHAVILAGGTDVGLRVSHRRERLPHVIHVAKVLELNALQDAGENVVIGAAVTYARAFDLLCTHFPGLRTYLTRLGSRQIRNLGTIGGNLGTASPIGDMLPVLLAVDAQVALYSAARGRRAIGAEEYFTGYRQTAMAKDELTEAVRIPKPEPNALFHVDKISKRRDQDISAVCSAFLLQLEGSTIREVRLAFGGMAATPKRAHGAEDALRGRRLDAAAVTAAIEALEADLSPLTDWRGSAEYRRLVAANLLRRLQLRVSEPATMMEVDAL
jgi:xanthine dehydrogenase small subunit